MRKLLVLLLLLVATAAQAQNPVATPGGSLMPYAVTGIAASSGNVAAATATATLPAIQGRFTYLCGFSATATGATAGAAVSLTVTGVNGGTLTYTYASATGAAVMSAPLVVPFNPCVPSSAANTAIVVSMPSLGTGNTNASVNAWGYQ